MHANIKHFDGRTAFQEDSLNRRMMHTRKGRYYIGRIHKGGVLTSTQIVEAIRNPTVIVKGKYSWTIAECCEGNVDGAAFIAGVLIKYDGHGEVPVIDDVKKTETTLGAPGLIAAKCPFVFFDSFSGFTYLHVWNAIEEDTFRRRMSELITAKYDDFFVQCEIDPIADIRNFSTRIASLKQISEVSAKVHPPNPLFGACWENLKNYLFERQTKNLQIKEECDDQAVGGLKTSIPEIIRQIVSGGRLTVLAPLSLTDASLLMATDGYGKGKVVGVDGDNSEIVIHTCETQKSFLFSKDPDIKMLAEESYRQLAMISTERKMAHA